MRHVPIVLGTAVLSSLALAGCPDREVSEVTPTQGKVEFKDIPVTVNRDLDLLFVIDNSGSMGEEQASLKANFPRFIEILSTIEGGLPNVHIAVVTSDMGTLGAPQFSDNCRNNGDDGLMRELPGQPNVRYISDLKDPTTQVRTTNYTGALSDVFGMIADVKTDGCGYESHLGAMRRSLENVANAGFLRPDAYLAVIIIADEDDCSLKAGQGAAFFGQPDLADVRNYGCFRASTICDDDVQLGSSPGPRANCRSRETSVTHEKVEAFVDFLNSKKTDPKLVVVAGIVGDPTPVSVLSLNRNGKVVPDLVPSCTYQKDQGSPLQRAFPAVRTAEFLKSFPNNTTTTICKGDLSDGLVQVATLLKTVIGSPCIDSDLAEPYQCSVVDVANQGSPSETRSVVGKCDETRSVKPCWSLDVDNAKCSTTKSKLALTVDRGGVTPAKDTHVVVNCVTK